MAVSLPYLVSYKNLPTLFEKINSAKVPDTFTHTFLQNTMGLKNTNDRAFIPLLRHLGFLDGQNIPTPAYRLLKGDKRRAVLADGVRRAYGPLFDADQSANELTGDRLKGLVAQVAGTDSDLTGRIANTFLALVNLGDFQAQTTPNEDEKRNEIDDQPDDEADERDRRGSSRKGIRTEFHYNLQIHLPSNGTEEVYLNIFNALRKTFQ
ncbi:DUF5343 domain-containing protein [Bradyrhizobium diazoefficiens]|nr:DUF5343 domain-containing protein [Bradyrhizobium diazoefficiens]UCF52178.1 MAG: DUF5343 domain-containing protein [Bradyrhizobium sp.]MBR0965118.1 DUF5343 domain-containing protein [Bradyrhizobium diazoefficiens]MBR0977515.1 DUF5343 domain-containing protein [Bradyrhizobium diazoefficiens]MBR1007803.1 DUF5343 domain-containing protein [Bradyrhizobium diazoefficiens]MBR1013580.1 DUF5343 domain-containing protein [Bradyrhizobium diazoefficiens]